MVPVDYSLSLASMLFAIGVAGVMVRRNLIIVLLCTELMLNAVSLAFIVLAQRFGNVDGHIFAIFVMAIGAIEAGVGLAMIVAIYREKKILSIDEIDVLKE